MNLTELADSFGTISAEDYKLTAVYLDEALHLIVNLESRIAALEAQNAELSAMRDTLNAVFTIEAPPAAPEYGICQRCNGTGKWTDNIGTVRLCGACDGLGEVQP
jgi:hypothetical protein